MEEDKETERDCSCWRHLKHHGLQKPDRELREQERKKTCYNTFFLAGTCYIVRYKFK